MIAAALALLLVAGLATAGGGSQVAAWPPGVAPIAAYVAQDRGLAFHHPVPVHFVAPAAFDREVAASDTPETAGQKADDRRYASELRGLGLLGGAVDLSGAQSSLDASDVDGYYDDTSRQITIRGTTLTPAVRVVLAHELTHVLQDQHFGLGRLDNHAVTSEQGSALTALEEGDAVLEEGDYTSSLPVAQQRSANAEMNAGGAGGTGGSGAKGDDVLNVIDEAPYVLGPDMVEAFYAVGGNAAIDRAYRHVPDRELDFLLPTAYLGRIPTRSLAPPRLSPGERRDGTPDDFGAFMLYLTLASRIDARTALSAADGWGGGSLVQYRAAGRSCTRVDLAGRSPAQQSSILHALTQWSAALPPGQATVAPAGAVVQLSACDPGRAARPGPHSLEAALTLADTRDSNIDQALSAGYGAGVAGCVGTGALGDPTLLSAENTADRGYGPTPASVQQTIDRQLLRLGRSCSH